MFRKCAAALAVAAIVPAQAGATFEEPTAVSVAGQEADSPQVAVDAAGNAVLAWERWDGSAWRVQARTRSAGGALGPVQAISSSSPIQHQPFVAVDADGDAVFAWSRWDGANFRVQMRARSAAGVLSSVKTLSPAGQTAFVNDLAVDADGDALAVWTRSDNLSQARARSAAGVLGPVHDLNSTGPIGPQARLAMDPAGDAVFTWLRWDGANNRAEGRALSAAGTLGPIQPLSAAGEQATRPEVAMESDGDAIFAWSEGDSIQSRRRTAGGALGGLKTIAPAGPAADEPQVAFDADGDAVFVWLRSDGANWRVEARRRTYSGSLSGVRTLSGAGQDASFPRLGVDSGGAAVVSWQRVDHADVSVVQARRRAADGTLSAVQTLSDGDFTAELPRVAVAPGGSALVAWQRFDGANTRIWAAAGP